jgi:hypothetical protein
MNAVKTKYRIRHILGAHLQESGIERQSIMLGGGMKQTYKCSFYEDHVTTYQTFIIYPFDQSVKS